LAESPHRTAAYDLFSGESLFLYKDLRVKTLKGFFEAVLDIFDQAQNPIAELRHFWEFVWGPEDTPTFGRLGSAAKRAGNGRSRPGCRILALRSVVAAVGRRVVGNPIDYVENMKGAGADHPSTGSGQAHDQGYWGWAPPETDWDNPDHGDWEQFISTSKHRPHRVEGA